jgi:hypothetical protein
MINRMLISMVVLSIATSAHAGIAPKDASYFCVGEFAGGLWYNERTKKWEGATFKPDAKFVMRMKHLRSETRKDSRGKDEPAQVFDVTITPEGGRVAETCLQPDGSVVFSSDRMTFRCLGVRDEYKFNLENNRFLSFYLFGYFDGADNNKDTPVVTGGVCTKID